MVSIFFCEEDSRRGERAIGGGDELKYYSQSGCRISDSIKRLEFILQVTEI